MGDERDYDLAILVILLLLCWPAAIVYYYTRPEKPPYPWARAFCQTCGAPIVPGSSFCQSCGKPLA